MLIDHYDYKLGLTAPLIDKNIIASMKGLTRNGKALENEFVLRDSDDMDTPLKDMQPFKKPDPTEVILKAAEAIENVAKIITHE